MTYTSCSANRSLCLCGQVGFGVRAKSGGLSPSQARDLAPFCTYRTCDTGPGCAPPVRLALLCGPAGRAVVHSVCAKARDGLSGGNYFSHLITNLPAVFDASSAVSLWEAPVWRVQDDDGPVEMPPLEESSLAANGVLAARLADALAEPLFAGFLARAVRAMLVRPKGGRVFLVAEPPIVALAVYGLCRALPPATVLNMTFSTYEHDPLNCSARVIGIAPADAGRLPARCATPPNQVVRHQSADGPVQGKRRRFLDEAVGMLAQGDDQGLDRLRKLSSAAGACPRLEHLDEALELLADGLPPSSRVRAIAQHASGQAALIARGPEAIEELMRRALGGDRDAQAALNGLSHAGNEATPQVGASWMAHAQTAMSRGDQFLIAAIGEIGKSVFGREHLVRL